MHARHLRKRKSRLFAELVLHADQLLTHRLDVVDQRDLLVTQRQQLLVERVLVSMQLSQSHIIKSTNVHTKLTEFS